MSEYNHHHETNQRFFPKRPFSSSPSNHDDIIMYTNKKPKLLKDIHEDDIVQSTSRDEYLMNSSRSCVIEPVTRRTDRRCPAIFVSGCATWWDYKTLMKFIDSGMEEQKLLRYDNGNPVLYCNIHKHAFKGGKPTAYVELRCPYETENLLELKTMTVSKGEFGGGIALEFTPWIERKERPSRRHTYEHLVDNRHRQREKVEPQDLLPAGTCYGRHHSDSLVFDHHHRHLHSQQAVSHKYSSASTTSMIVQGNKDVANTTSGADYKNFVYNEACKATQVVVWANRSNEWSTSWLVDTLIAEMNQNGVEDCIDAITNVYPADDDFSGGKWVIEVGDVVSANKLRQYLVCTQSWWVHGGGGLSQSLSVVKAGTSRSTPKEEKQLTVKYRCMVFQRPPVSTTSVPQLISFLNDHLQKNNSVSRHRADTGVQAFQVVLSAMTQYSAALETCWIVEVDSEATQKIISNLDPLNFPQGQSSKSILLFNESVYDSPMNENNESEEGKAEDSSRPTIIGVDDYSYYNNESSCRFEGDVVETLKKICVIKQEAFNQDSDKSLSKNQRWQEVLSKATTSGDNATVENVPGYISLHKKNVSYGNSSVKPANTKTSTGSEMTWSNANSTSAIAMEKATGDEPASQSYQEKEDKKLNFSKEEWDLLQGSLRDATKDYYREKEKVERLEQEKAKGLSTESKKYYEEKVKQLEEEKQALVENERSALKAVLINEEMAMSSAAEKKRVKAIAKNTYEDLLKAKKIAVSAVREMENYKKLSERKVGNYKRNAQRMILEQHDKREFAIKELKTTRRQLKKVHEVWQTQCGQIKEMKLKIESLQQKLKQEQDVCKALMAGVVVGGIAAKKES